LTNTFDSAAWTEAFGDQAGRPVALFRAPGRVNIIGEHTDYNDGLVLPTTTAAYTWLAAAERDDRLVQICSENMGTTESFNLDDRSKSDSPRWIDYAVGVAAEIEALNVELRGADILVDGNIPLGGGLSSSASFEVAIATALLALAGESLAQLQIAQLCQRAEIHYARVNCGIMDQYVIAACDAGKAMLIDCRSLESRMIGIPEDMRLLVTDSGVKHQLPTSGYNDRAQECMDARNALAELVPGFSSLRDLSAQQLASLEPSMDEVQFRRSRHVVTENQRVTDAVQALQNHDLNTLGNLISASHQSLRADFEVSCPAVDELVGLADSCDGVLGSRMVGAGFGGCVLSLTTADAVDEVRQQISSKHAAVTGQEPWMHVVQATAPAQIVTQS
jgi:galactokinase